MKAILIALLIFILIVVGFIRTVSEFVTIGELAMIEQLRFDVQHVDPNASEDVMGQITKWNQHIMAYKRYRMYWFFRIFIPEEWEKVDVIKTN